MTTTKELAAALIEAVEQSGYFLTGIEIHLPETDNLIGKEVNVYLTLINPAATEFAPSSKEP